MTTNLSFTINEELPASPNPGSKDWTELQFERALDFEFSEDESRARLLWSGCLLTLEEIGAAVSDEALVGREHVSLAIQFLSALWCLRHEQLGNDVHDHGDFSAAVHKRRGEGQREYAGGDRAFGNFERLSEQLEGLTRDKVLWIYAMKHRDGIQAWIDGHRSQREDVLDRILDLTVYVLLLHAMNEEDRELGPEDDS